MLTDIVYSPIDIDVKLPPKDELVEYVKNMTILKPDDPYKEGITLMVGHIAKMNNYKAHMSWRNGGLLIDKNNPELTDIALKEYDRQFIKSIDRNKKYDFYWEPTFEQKFPTIIEAVNKIPFKQLFAVFFGYAGYEISPTHKDNYNFMNEKYIHLERYNILLTCHDIPCFYVTKDKENTKHVYPKIINPVYAFDNTLCYHGSAKPTDETKDRIQLLVWGIIDEAKHRDLVECSINKYQDSVIRLSDLE